MRKKKYTNKVGSSLEKGMFLKLVKIQAKTGKTRSQIIREALEAYDAK